ncbi:MAG TPA: hypothetical protein VMC85_20895 [Desulfomonilaceae bacterium]|nr:hypothetical protein [Desulfomonilaceae bacterium]
MNQNSKPAPLTRKQQKEIEDSNRDWVESIERINNEKRQEAEQRLSDDLERIFGVR